MSSVTFLAVAAILCAFSAASSLNAQPPQASQQSDSQKSDSQSAPQTTPNPSVRPAKPKPRPPIRPARPPHWGHNPAQRPSYNFRPTDPAYLHRYYANRLTRINRSGRVRVVIGGFFPYADIRYLAPLPPHVYHYLPPPPHGYAMGYFDGYVLVYDPVTYYIANVIDLMQ